MPAGYPYSKWVPYVLAMVGIILSILLWALLWFDVHAYFDFLNTLRLYLPWLMLVLGLGISVLVAIIVHMWQLARLSSISLNDVNNDLKKEIAERILAEETKQKLEVALLQGQKLQAIGTLAGGIAHDFNNLLYAIIGYVEMARDDVEKDSVIYKNLGRVLDATHRGQELVARILSFSRRQHHHFDRIDLTHTIEAALALLGPTIPASVLIEFEPVADVYIQGNQTQIHQVLVNLINNAVDAMDGEGKIKIKMSHITKGDPSLKQFPGILEQDYCKIEISDTGHGMDQPTMVRIFEPFFTTKEVGKGTGLGLSIVHSIIKEHQGEITVQSLLGQGTMFTLLLPEQKGE